MQRERGFTIPELLVVGGFIAILLLLSVWLVHPKNYTVYNHNAERWLSVAAIMDGVTRYYHQNGKLPEGLTNKPQTIATGQGNINLCTSLVPKYLTDLPFDPIQGAEISDADCRGDAQNEAFYTTFYTISLSKDNKVTVAAPGAELHAKISVTRQF